MVIDSWRDGRSMISGETFSGLGLAKMRLHMLPHCLIVVAAIVSMTRPSISIAQDLIGTFRSKVVVGTSSVDLKLQCGSETSCEFSTANSDRGQVPTEDRQTLNAVQPLANLQEVNYALRYAYEHRNAKVHHEEYAAIMAQLRPLLAKDPKIDKCWDLNYPSPTYMVVCFVSDPAWRRNSALLFGTLLAGCSEAFCRYVINPMQRTTEQGPPTMKFGGGAGAVTIPIHYQRVDDKDASLVVVSKSDGNVRLYFDLQKLDAQTQGPSSAEALIRERAVAKKIEIIKVGDKAGFFDQSTPSIRDGRPMLRLHWQFGFGKTVFLVSAEMPQDALDGPEAKRLEHDMEGIVGSLRRIGD